MYRRKCNVYLFNIQCTHISCGFSAAHAVFLDSKKRGANYGSGVANEVNGGAAGGGDEPNPVLPTTLESLFAPQWRTQAVQDRLRGLNLAAATLPDPSSLNSNFPVAPPVPKEKKTTKNPVGRPAMQRWTRKKSVS
jgi:hypothetical protein